jgi:hypothetical protein
MSDNARPAAPFSAGALTWPAERFLWAVIESAEAAAAVWNRDGAIPAGLISDVADQIPAPIEELHAVAAAAGSGRLIVCLARRDELVTLTSDASARSLTPANIPPELGASDLDPRRLNLLVDAFEPLALRRARTRRHTRAAAGVLLIAGLVSIGLWRREHAALESARRAQAASERVLAELGFTDNGMAKLNAELEQRRGMAGIDLALRQPPDAAAALNLVLSAWPTESSAKLQSVGLGPDGAVLSVLVPPPGDSAAFLSSLKPIDGWTLDEPRLASVGSETRLTLRMRPKPTAAKLAGGAHP